MVEDLGVPSQAPVETQGDNEPQAPAYALNANIGLKEPLGKDERMMMDTRNGVTTAVPMTMSDQEANYWIENQDKMGAVPPKSPEYNRIINAIQTGGASEQVFQPWKQVSDDFLKNGLQGLSMNIYKPSQAEEQFYQTFQRGTSQFDQTIGQLGSFIGTSYAVAQTGGLAALGLGAMKIGILPDAFTGLVAKFGLEGAVKVSAAAGAAANMEATGTIVSATSRIQNELKAGQPVDYAKDIGEAAADSAKWSLIMGAGAAIAKPFEGVLFAGKPMSTGEAAGEIFKRATFAGGTTYALMRADNSSHEDSLLGATLMTGLALVHGGGELMDAEAHGKIGQQAINGYARYFKDSNFAISEPNAYEIGKQVVTDTAKMVIEQSKPITEEERQGEQMSAEGAPVQEPMEQVAKDPKLSEQLHDNLVRQVVLPEGEQELNRGEVTPQEGENAISGGTGNKEGNLGETQQVERQKEEKVPVRGAETQVGVETEKRGEVGNQKPVESEGKLKKSKLIDRMMADVPEEEKKSELYNEMSMREQMSKSLDLQKSNPDLVERIAKGLEPVPEGYTGTAIRSAYYSSLRDAGKTDEANSQLTRDTMRGTRLGQEVAMYKQYGKDGSEEHTPETFIKKAIQDKVKTIGQKLSGKGTASEKFFKEVDKQKAKVKDVIDKADLSDEDIQKVIDSIICP